MTIRFHGVRAFRHRNYRLFFAGQLISLIGTWMQQVAQAWLVLQLTHDPLWLGLVAVAQFAPGHRLRPVRRRHRRSPAEAQDAARDPVRRDDPRVHPVRADRDRRRRGLARHGPGGPARDQQRGRHADPPGVRGRDGRPRGHDERRRAERGPVQCVADPRPGCRRAADRRVRHLDRLPHQRRQLPRRHRCVPGDARERAPIGGADGSPDLRPGCVREPRRRRSLRPQHAARAARRSWSWGWRRRSG